MTLIRYTACIATLIASTLGGAAASADAYHLILVGSGGEPEYDTRFQSWGARLETVLTTRMEVASDHVGLLSASSKTFLTEAVTGIDRETIEAAFEQLKRRIQPEEDVYIYLIGHGSYIKDVSNFHVPGPDLTARDLGKLLDSIECGTVTVINSTSSSAGFINELSGPDRIVCSATKNVAEVNATEFMRFFIEALEEGSADRNHDERISVLEACEQAAELTESWYVSETLIATEHAILDDNGDGLGSRLPIGAFLVDTPEPDEASDNQEDDDTVLDGELASETFIKNFSFPENAPQDLIDGYLQTLDEVESLRRRRSEFEEDAYYLELEKLFLEAARANREIRSYRETTPAFQ